jgi:hypothetical protein
LETYKEQKKHSRKIDYSNEMSIILTGLCACIKGIVHLIKKEVRARPEVLSYARRKPQLQNSFLQNKFLNREKNSYFQIKNAQ